MNYLCAGASDYLVANVSVFMIAMKIHGACIWLLCGNGCLCIDVNGLIGIYVALLAFLLLLSQSYSNILLPGIKNRLAYFVLHSPFDIFATD